MHNLLEVFVSLQVSPYALTVLTVPGQPGVPYAPACGKLGGHGLHLSWIQVSKNMCNLLVPRVLSSIEKNLSMEIVVCCRSQFRLETLRSILKSKRRKK